jgi:cyclophilin family peptidyl-prolyl cis-trans isomerase
MLHNVFFWVTFANPAGTGSTSIYGSRYADEAFTGKHTGPGLLSSANSGPNTNGCQFFLTCAKAGEQIYYVVVTLLLCFKSLSGMGCHLPSADQTQATASSSCAFFADWLDTKHVVFGRVIQDGLLVVRKLSCCKLNVLLLLCYVLCRLAIQQARRLWARDSGRTASCVQAVLLQA